jgi:hypothetical protein
MGYFLAVLALCGTVCAWNLRDALSFSNSLVCAVSFHSDKMTLTLHACCSGVGLATDFLPHRHLLSMTIFYRQVDKFYRIYRNI